MPFHLFQCRSNLIKPDAICWSCLTPADILWSYSFSSFISFSMYSYKSLIPFSSTITLPILLSNSLTHYILSFFYHLHSIQKISFWRLRSFKSLAPSFRFFSFAEEMTRCILSNSLHSFHACVDFSLFLFPYFIFYYRTASATSSFHHHVSLCLHGPFDNPYVMFAVSINIFFHLLPVFIYSKAFPLCFFYFVSDHALVFLTNLFLLKLPYMHSWF